VTTFPSHVTLCPIGPRCTRCGAVWDRTLAADADAELGDREDYIRADAVLRGLLAFAEWHRWCAAGEEVSVEPATVAPAPREVVPLPAEPKPCCPQCGQRYRNPWFRRCFVCKPSVGPRGKSWRSIARGANGKATA
jgi:tRNA(Ile2) C34 agmatinyltransferase TiaS